MRQTQRLIIRPLYLNDYENWRQAYSLMKPAQNEWDESPWRDSELTRAKFKKILNEQQKLRIKDQAYSYGVFLIDDGVLIGTVHLMDVIRKRFQNAYLGYRIFNNHWGEGYATEACSAIIDIAFRDLKLHRIEAGIEPHNKASIRVAKKIGLRKEGLSLRRMWFQDKWVDLLLYAATREDFGKRYPRIKWI